MPGRAHRENFRTSNAPIACASDPGPIFEVLTRIFDVPTHIF